MSNRALNTLKDWLKYARKPYMTTRETSHR